MTIYPDIHFLNLEPELSEQIGHDWQAQIKRFALEHCKQIERQGPGPGSLDATGLKYEVCDGTKIARDFPTLSILYESWSLTERVNQMFNDDELLPLVDPSGVNINLLRGPGGYYEWHTDGQPYVLLLFANDIGEEDGGELELLLPDSLAAPTLPLLVRPRAGFAVLFDGAKYPHRVRPITGDSLRVTVPMMFSRPEDIARRDPRLNDYLFRQGAE